MNNADLSKVHTQGITIRTSNNTVRETMDLLAQSVEEHGATIYARINQQAEALKAGVRLPPLEYLLFGSPEKGTRLMATNPLIALDLPLKIICWQDQDGSTLVAFNDHEYIARRYGLDTPPDSPLNLVYLIDQALK